MAPKKPANRAQRPFAGAPRAGKRSAQNQPTPSATAPATPAASGRERRFPIVGIGASAGGLEALDELFAHMPKDTGMAFVVITHQHPGHTSLLPELLGKITNLTVRQAADGLKVEPDHVYVSPPGGHLAILGGTLHRMETEKKEAPHLPIDYFFRSLAVDQKDKAICIVLSGTGTDGTLGLKAVKGESGMAMVQQCAVGQIRRHAEQRGGHRPGGLCAAGDGDAAAAGRLRALAVSCRRAFRGDARRVTGADAEDIRAAARAHRP